MDLETDKDMPEKKLELKEEIKKLDVICSVIQMALVGNTRVTKHDLKMILGSAEKVVEAYYAKFDD